MRLPANEWHRTLRAATLPPDATLLNPFMRRPAFRAVQLTFLAVTASVTVHACAGRTAETAERALLISNARVLDGTGAPPRDASVRVRHGRIVAVGALAPERGDSLIDAAGLTLAPGFIDTHSHHDRGLDTLRGALALVSQGITTIVIGQDGGSQLPLAAYFAKRDALPAAVNVASYTGHGTIRRRVLGDDFKRHASPADVDRMRALLAADLGAGSLGLSTGLEYDPGIYSHPDEVLSLARLAADSGGRYISHMRSEDREFFRAVDELLAIGRQTRMPVQISHAKLAMRALWGRAPELIARLDSARAAGIDVTMDVYPYTYWQSTLTVLFPERDFQNRATAEFVLREIAAPEGLLLSRYGPNPEYVGRTVADIATLRGMDPPSTLMWLIATAENAERSGGDGDEGVIGTSMDERDIDVLMAWPHANICSDGELAGRHPRGVGSFPRVLGRYARDRGVLRMEEAVRRMTSLPAHNVGIRDRGTIAAGMAADLVLFDPARVIDRATPTDPRAKSEGVERVWVNGVQVYTGGTPTGAYPGRVIRRARGASR